MAVKNPEILVKEANQRLKIDTPLTEQRRSLLEKNSRQTTCQTY